MAHTETQLACTLDITTPGPSPFTQEQYFAMLKTHHFIGIIFWQNIHSCLHHPHEVKEVEEEAEEGEDEQDDGEAEAGPGAEGEEGVGVLEALDQGLQQRLGTGICPGEYLPN